MLPVKTVFSSLSRVAGILPPAWGEGFARRLAVRQARAIAKPGSVAGVINTNLYLCDAWLREHIPEHDPEHMLQQNLFHQARMFWDQLHLYRRTPEEFIAMLEPVSLQAALARAASLQAEGRGLLLCYCHSLCLREFIAALCELLPGPMVALRRTTLTFHDERAWKLEYAKPDQAGLRAARAALTAGGTAVIGADQQPDRGRGVLVDFLGVRSWTYTTPGSLVRSTGARGMALGFARSAEGIRVLHAEMLSDFGGVSKEASARACNSAFEGLIAAAPEHFMWNYRRFSHSPGHEGVYQRSSRWAAGSGQV